MIKHTPNPPESETDTDPASPYESLDSKKFHEAAERARGEGGIPHHKRRSEQYLLQQLNIQKRPTSI